MQLLRPRASLLIETTRRWAARGATTQAAALAFFALTSLAPLLIIAVTIAGAVLGEEAVRGALVERIEGQVGREAAVLIQNQVRSTALTGSGLIAGLLAVLTGLLAASGLFSQLRTALNAIWDVPRQRRSGLRRVVLKRLLAFGLVVAAGGMLLLSLIAQTILSGAAAWISASLGVGVPTLLLTELSVFLVVATAFLALLYRTLPDTPTPWRSAFVGAGATALLFLPGRWLIGLYLGHASVASAYGAAGSLVVLLFWIYYMGLLFLWGGALARSHALLPGAADHAGAPPENGSGSEGPDAPAPVRHPRSRAMRSALFWVPALWIGVAAIDAGAQEPRLRVEVQGVDGEARRNVMAVLGVARLDGVRASEAEVSRLHRRAPGEIARALEPFGFYRIRVAESSLAIEGGRRVARYSVEPGEAIRLRTVRVQAIGPGAEDPLFGEAVGSFPLRTGDVLLHASYEAGKAAMVEAATRHGYLDAAFDTSEIRVDLDAYVADLVLLYRTGPRFAFGPVTFVQDVLDEDVLRGLVPFREGDPFDAARLLELQVALSQGPWFAGVEVVPQRDRAVGLEVPIVVDLRPRPAQRYLVGAGYGTDTGPRGTFEFQLRRVGRMGHRAEGRIRASAIERDVIAQYSIPWLYPRTEVLALTAGFADQNTRTSESEKLMLGATLSRSRGRWRESISLNYQRESFRAGEDSGVSNLLLAGISWTRTVADDRVYPLRGYRLRLQAQGAHDAVLADVSLFQLNTGLARVVSPAPGTRLLLRTDAGATFSPAFRDIPATLRFFAGGDQSVRGFGYRTLGPADEAGDIIGGEYLLTGSLELEQRVLERWGGAVFLDAGNAFSAGDERVEIGAGIGLRWLSPVGLIRLDGAWALSRNGLPFRLHIRIGPDL